MGSKPVVKGRCSELHTGAGSSVILKKSYLRSFAAPRSCVPVVVLAYAKGHRAVSSRNALAGHLRSANNATRGPTVGRHSIMPLWNSLTPCHQSEFLNLPNSRCAHHVLTTRWHSACCARDVRCNAVAHKGFVHQRVRHLARVVASCRVRSGTLTRAVACYLRTA